MSRVGTRARLACWLTMVLVATILVNKPRSATAAGAECGTAGGAVLNGNIGQGSVSATGSCHVIKTDLPGLAGSPVLVIDCGYVPATESNSHWDKACGPTGFPCPPVAGVPNPHQFITVLSLLRTTVPIAAWCAGGTNPMPSTAALRDEVIRLLHPPALGVSPSTGTALVNFRTLLWVDTPTQRELGRSKLIGFPVNLRVHYVRTEFDFGDGASGVLIPDAGTPYRPSEDCGRCTDRFGHDYTAPGAITVTARVYWQAQFQIAGEPWTDIPGEVTATTPSRTAFVVKQSRSTLIAPR